jgi:retinol dehydrogenase-12
MSTIDDTLLKGQVAVVTGANSGIGKETAVALAQRGAHVVVAARNAPRAGAAVKEIKERAGAGDRADTLPLDLASFDAVQAFADEFRARYGRLDILVNNAGVILRERHVTVDGHEMQFQVNHLGHFLLTNLLRDLLAESDEGRVVNVASEAHRSARRGLKFDDLEWERRRYGIGFSVYAATKLMNILFTRELDRRLADTNVTANAVHPGFVGSNFARDGDAGRLGDIVMRIARPLALSPEKGAETSIYVASSPEVDGVSGQYFTKSRVAVPARHARDDAAAARLWTVSETLTAT